MRSVFLSDRLIVLFIGISLLLGTAYLYITEHSLLACLGFVLMFLLPIYIGDRIAAKAFHRLLYFAGGFLIFSGASWEILGYFYPVFRGVENFLFIALGVLFIYAGFMLRRVVRDEQGRYFQG